ncbi:hypothetical protein AMD26_002045 [Deinococcus sp. UR1]|nr:hypothetical protein AMD26_002045 [Deinococcus sp. UR1]
MITDRRVRIVTQHQKDMKRSGRVEGDRLSDLIALILSKSLQCRPWSGFVMSDFFGKCCIF